MKIHLSILLYVFCLTAAKAQNLNGSWNGELPTGTGSKLHVTFNIKQTGNIYTSTFDVLEQKAMGIPCATVFNKDSVTINITAIGAVFKGRLVGNTINGLYAQNKVSFPLVLARQLRPQTPQPPYTYVSEDVEYDNTAKSVHFGATLTKPNGSGKFPAVIIISGSGTQDRDGTLFGHKLYAVLANHLTQNGIAVLRVDDRGAGKTTVGPDAANLTSASFALDVEAGLNYLKTRADILPNHLGLVGHSEGGIIAPMVASRRKDVSFIIMWGAPVIGGAAISTEQNADQLTQALQLNEVAGGKETVKAFKQLHLQELKQFATVANAEELNAKVLLIFNNWKSAQSADVLKRLMVADNSIVGQSVTGMYGGLYNIPWMRYFITYDPVTDLSKVTCPILAINGSKDTQVNAAANLKLINEVLTKSGNKNYKTLALPGLNHLLQTAQTGNLTEYAQIEETMSPMALNTIANWIKEHVK